MMQLTTTKGFAPATMGEAMEFSKMLADSSMVPRAYQGKPQDIMVCVQWGYELGLAPMQALQNIAVINGKPSVYGDAMAALVQASPVCDGIDETFEGVEGTGEFAAVCIARRKGRQPVTIKFSVNDAKRAGLWNKQGPWTQYPKRMLQMRARGFALRDAFPDVLKGLISAEEAADYPDDAKPRPIKDVTPIPANPLDMIAPPAPPEPIEIQEIVDGVVEIMNQTPVEDLIASGKAFFDAVMAAQDTDELQNEPEDSDAVESYPQGYPLMVPDMKAERAEGEPVPALLNSTWSDIDAWCDAYEELADKTARAGKRPARERMTILKELRNANQSVIEKIDPVKRLRHSASYAKRLAALGASMGGSAEKNPGT